MSTARYVVTEHFREEDKVYCLRLGPVDSWNRGSASFCCLEVGHEGEHIYRPKWVPEKDKKKTEKTVLRFRNEGGKAARAKEQPVDA